MLLSWSFIGGGNLCFKYCREFIFSARFLGDIRDIDALRVTKDIAITGNCFENYLVAESA